MQWWLESFYLLSQVHGSDKEGQFPFLREYLGPNQVLNESE